MNQRFIGAERAAARLDRDTWLNWSPQGRPGTPNYRRGHLARGYQLGDAIVRAVLAHPTVHPITKRVSQNVR